MAGKLSTLPAGVQAHLPVRGASSITTNTRVRTSLGYVGLATDTVIFAGGSGTWLLSNQRVSVNNIPTIGAGSVGTSVIGNSSGSMTVVQADNHPSGM